MDKQSRKLQSALIETGKEVETMKSTPGILEMEAQFTKFKAVALSLDLKAARKHGRHLCALVTKFMIEKL